MERLSPLEGPKGLLIPKSPPPMVISRALKHLGRDISLARRRRRLSQFALAERCECSVSTVRRMEKGDPRTPVHFVLRALQEFGVLRRLDLLLGQGRDRIGGQHTDALLPERVHFGRPQPKTSSKKRDRFGRGNLPDLPADWLDR